MKTDQKMILPDEAADIIGGYGKKSEIEEVRLSDSLGRILAEDIYSEIDMPPFDKSAMDGFAVFSGDNSKRYKIVETIPAGKFPKRSVGKGECSRIMTGAPIPSGTDRVIKVEVTGEDDGYMYLNGEDSNNNICLMGEDIKKGDKILVSGTLMRAPEIGAAASLGLGKLQVYKRVKTGIITTGSEIVEPGGSLLSGHIFNSNGYSLSAQLADACGEVSEMKIVPDERGLLKDSLGKMIETFDLTIISGGVSMGNYDFVPDILEELGVTIHFNKVAIQPGKPTLFGTKNDKVIFGLPGNPVSTFVVFEILVKPLVMRMGGNIYSPLFIRGKLNGRFMRRKKERDLYIPVFYDKGEVNLIEYHGSAHFVSLSKANGLMKIGRGVSEIPQGEIVNVRQI